MKKIIIVNRAFGWVNALVGGAVLLLCLWCGWNFTTAATAALLSGGLTLPMVLLLHGWLLLVRRVRLAPSFAWMLLLGAVPLMTILPAWLLAPALPGDLPLLLSLGWGASYAGILSQGLTITQYVQQDHYDNQ